MQRRIASPTSLAVTASVLMAATIMVTPSIAQTLEPKTLEPKTLEPKTLEPKTLETEPLVMPPAKPALIDNPAFDTDDRAFISRAFQMSNAEIRMGREAQKRNGPSFYNLRSFGTQMMDDHSAANRELARITGVTDPSSVDLSKRHFNILSSMRGMQERSFEALYLQTQIEDHQAAIELFTKQANDGQNPQLRQFAAAQLPRLQNHLDQAIALQSRYGSPPSAAQQPEGEMKGTGSSQ